MEDVGTKEKTLIEEIQDLPIDDTTKTRIVKKYWNAVEEHRNTLETIRAEAYKDRKEIVKKNKKQEVIISVLTSYIEEKELL